MFKISAAIFAATLMLMSQPTFAAARVAILHLAPFAENIDDTAVNIAVDGDVLFTGVKYKDFVDYTELAAGEHTIDIFVAGTTEPVLSATVNLMDNTDYTVFAAGNAITQDLSLNAVEDMGNMPSDPANVALRVIHTAPFAATAEKTEVSIRTAGGDVVAGLVGVPYLGNSGFLEVPADTYDLKVASNDGNVNLIDPLPAPLPADNDVTIFAIGDGINQPLSILAFPVGELETRRPVDNRSSGLWTILDASGFGMVLIPMPKYNRLIGKWYQPDTDGSPAYLMFDSCFDDADPGEDYQCSTPGGFDGVMATNKLYRCEGGSLDGSMAVDCTHIGEFDVEIFSCEDAMVTVRLENQDPVMLDARSMTRGNICNNEDF